MNKITRKQIAKTFASAWVQPKTDHDRLMLTLAALLKEQKMLGQADLIISDIKQSLERDHGIVAVEVFSKFPLTSSNKDNIEKLVLRKNATAKKVVIDQSIDDSILGGALIATPDSVIDLTLNNKLKALVRN